MKLAKGSLSWIVSPLFLGCIFLLISFLLSNTLRSIFFFIAFLLFLLTGFFLMFFRDPDRKITSDIVVCADGRIREITTIDDRDVVDAIKISTFMNVYNVHVNRMPFKGVIKRVQHKPGSYLPAFKKESEKNERLIITIDSSIGTFKIIQIAGTLAKRIVPYVKEGDTLMTGEKIGLIRLGSRVDIILPSKKIRNVRVHVGDRVKAGVDCLAEING
jgi:phosphatidylserine decarboxylase